jgi:hypothetical protein
LSTALRASRPAASITDGFEVLVHDVIAAIVDGTVVERVLAPSAAVTGLGLEAVAGAANGASRRWSCAVLRRVAGGSDAGNDSATSRSTRSCSASA